MTRRPVISVVTAPGASKAAVQRAIAAAQDRKAAGRLDRVIERHDDLLARGAATLAPDHGAAFASGG